MIKAITWICQSIFIFLFFTLKLYENNKVGDNGAEHTGECGSVDGEEFHGTQLGDQAQPLH